MTTYITREEFERWLALQLALGWTVRNPEVLSEIRREFKAGAKVAPFREISRSKEA